VSKLPADRFDDKSAAPTRVGAHRRRVVRRAWWVTTLISVGSVAAIILAALVGVSVIDAKNLQALDIPAIGITATPTPTPTPTPTSNTIDPLTLPKKELDKIAITVLNGTPQEGLAESVVTMLETTGWVNMTAAAAADDTIKVSVVVYGPATDEAYAHGVASSLGIKAVKQSDMYPGANVTVLLGSDFVQQ
jgi:negative regulator of sigma E activity